METIPKYQNMSYSQSCELFNKCGKCLEQLHCKWYGSAYSVSSGKVAYLRDLIITGRITIFKFKKIFNEASLLWIKNPAKAEEYLKPYRFLFPCF